MAAKSDLVQCPLTIVKSIVLFLLVKCNREVESINSWYSAASIQQSGSGIGCLGLNAAEVPRRRGG